MQHELCMRRWHPNHNAMLAFVWPFTRRLSGLFDEIFVTVYLCSAGNLISNQELLHPGVVLSTTYRECYEQSHKA